MTQPSNSNLDAHAGAGTKTPTLSPRGMAKLREIFGQAVEVFGPEREALIRERLGEGLEAADPEAPAIRVQLRSLLAAHEDSALFLSEPAIGLQTKAAMAELVDREAADDASYLSGTFSDSSNDRADPLIGATLGDYTIQSVLGAGGMGVVYLARQQHPRREVALKVIRWVFASKSLLRRFEHEARALARLQHPGIAQIYEAGSAAMPDGRSVPFFAMELVRGATITRYASDSKLSIRDRLAIFADLCDAVHHAHQKGVIHRDLKPANILIDASRGNDTDASTRLGPRVQPKILDFGVARLAQDETGVQTLHTSVTQAGQILGTLPYMSPEQLAGDAADTRVDVYALGVILYELLTGKLPHELTGMNLAAAAISVRNASAAPPSKHDASLKGDVETIVLKAIAPEASQRYQSAGALASDVRAYLADLPIAARPATTMYQLRTFARRNRAVVVGAVAVFAALVMGVAGTGVGLYRANQALVLAEQRRQQASIAARTAEESERFLTSILTAANPLVSKNRDLTVRELIDEAAGRVGAEFSGEPAVALRSRIALGKTYLSIAAYESALAQVDAAEQLAIERFGEGSVEHSLALALRADYHLAKAQAAEALPIMERCLAMRHNHLPSDDVLVAKAEQSYGRILVTAAKFQDGLPRLRRALAIFEAHGDIDALTCANELASALSRSRSPGSAEEAQSLLRSTLEKSRVMGPRAQGVTASTLLGLADWQRARRQYRDAKASVQEAIAIRASIYPPDHPMLLVARLSLAKILRSNAEPEASRREVEDLLPRVERVMGKDAGTVIDLNTERARACLATSDLDCALESAMRVREGVRKASFVQQITCASLLTEIYMAREEWDMAIATCDEALSAARERKVSMQNLHAIAQYRVRSLLASGKAQAALDSVDATLAELPDTEAAMPARLEVRALRADVLDGLKRHAEAQAELQSVIEAIGTDDPAWLAELWDQLAASLATSGDAPGAALAREKAASARALVGK